MVARLELLTGLDMIARLPPPLVSVLLGIIEHGGELQGRALFLKVVDTMKANGWAVPEDDPETYLIANLPVEWLEKLHEELVNHSLPLSAKLAKTMIAERAGGRLDGARRYGDLADRIRHELESQSFVMVPQTKVSFLEAAPFGERVAGRFPVAMDDVEQAGCCIALGLNTAAVFHLMRVVECALRELAASLGMPDPTGGDRSWGTMLDSIRKAIDAKRDHEWRSGEKPLFLGAHGLLVGVKDAWRNECMHLDAKYDEADALRIFHAVNGFMGHLAKLPKKQGGADVTDEG